MSRASVPMPEKLLVSNRQEYKQQLLNALTLGVDEVVADASDTRYIDSSGLGILVSVTKHASEKGKKLIVKGLSTELQLLMELSRIDSIIHIEP